MSPLTKEPSTSPHMDMPSRAEMLRAFTARDGDYDGLFFTAVRTTGIFCRPTCPARKPLPKNVEFFPNITQAMAAGYRPCKRCHPLAAVGQPPPELGAVLDAIDADPSQRITDADLRDRGVHPDRARRWFLRHHGMTFHAYARARRLGTALGAIRRGSSVTDAAMGHGYDSLSAFNRAFARLLGDAPTRKKNAPVLTVLHLPTVLGAMVAGATEEGLVLLEFADRRMLQTQLRTLDRRLGCRWVPGETPVLRELREEITAYFEGEQMRFSVPLAPVGSDFQKRVWRELAAIPPGTTRSYGEVAAAIGKPSAVRAVARANGHNRIAILIPCHRVIGKDGALTGYGGGLWRKKRLLELEHASQSRKVGAPSG